MSLLSTMCVEAVIGRGLAAVFSCLLRSAQTLFFGGASVKPSQGERQRRGRRGEGEQQRGTQAVATTIPPASKTKQPNVAKVGSGGRLRMSAVCACTLLHTKYGMYIVRFNFIISMFIVSMRTLKRTTNM